MKVHRKFPRARITLFDVSLRLIPSDDNRQRGPSEQRVSLPPGPSAAARPSAQLKSSVIIALAVLKSVFSINQTMVQTA